MTAIVIGALVGVLVGLVVVDVNETGGGNVGGVILILTAPIWFPLGLALEILERRRHDDRPDA